MLILNPNDCLRLWKIANFTCASGYFKDGYPVNHLNEGIVVPQIENIYEEIKSSFENNGFTVTRAFPLSSNSIIRIFRNPIIEYKNEYFWMFGSDVFLRTNSSSFVSYCGNRINYSQYKVGVWFSENELSIFEPNFVDYYLTIK